ncbi:MAG: pentapeptide repeat-containing protein [Myxococcota bacterium]
MLADLSGADLTNASFNRVLLTGADLSDADLSGAESSKSGWPQDRLRRAVDPLAAPALAAPPERVLQTETEIDALACPGCGGRSWPLFCARRRRDGGVCLQP